MLGDGDNVTIGRPTVEGARVMAAVRENGRGDKIIVFKYKAKVRYRRKNGHRQDYTALNIEKILPPGAKAEKPKPAKKAEPKVEEPQDEVAETKTEAPAAEQPKARTAARKTAAPKAAATKTAKAPARTAKPKATTTRTTKAKTSTTAAEKPVKKTAPRKKKEETAEDGA